MNQPLHKTDYKQHVAYLLRSPQLPYKLTRIILFKLLILGLIWHFLMRPEHINPTSDSVAAHILHEPAKP